LDNDAEMEDLRMISSKGIEARGTTRIRNRKVREATIAEKDSFSTLGFAARRRLGRLIPDRYGNRGVNTYREVQNGGRPLDELRDQSDPSLSRYFDRVTRRIRSRTLPPPFRT